MDVLEMKNQETASKLTLGIGWLGMHVGSWRENPSWSSPLMKGNSGQCDSGAPATKGWEGREDKLFESKHQSGGEIGPKDRYLFTHSFFRSLYI